MYSVEKKSRWWCDNLQMQTDNIRSSLNSISMMLSSVHELNRNAVIAS